MGNGANFNYDFGPKRQWRRTTWNSIRDRLPTIGVRVKDAVVLYLAGEHDLDREIAISKGFKDRNLIAVDRDRKIVSSLRSGGALAVCGSLEHVVQHWSGQVNVVIADMCCGFTESPITIAVHMIVNPSFETCLSVFNLMKGREKWTSGAGDFAKGRHRGEAIANMAYGFVRTKINDLPEDVAKNVFMSVIDEMEKKENGFIRGYSYKSTSGQVFDSAIFRNPSLAKIARITAIACKNLLPESDHSSLWSRMESAMAFLKPDTTTPIARQILAIRATRTRQMKTK